MKIKYTDVEEFVNEMERDREDIHRGIVRLAKFQRPVAGSRGIFAMGVIATYRRGDEIVMLESHCGHYMGEVGKAISERTIDAQKATYELLRSRILSLGLEIRGGVYK